MISLFIFVLIVCLAFYFFDRIAAPAPVKTAICIVGLIMCLMWLFGGHLGGLPRLGR